MTPVNNRTMNLGRIAELKERLMALRVLLHNNCSAIVLHFDPMDADLQYVQNIKVSQLETTVKEIKKLRKEFDQIAREIERLQGELGENAS
jgi:SMC interacting uncharacterized protein involved in chromosome segregation